ncbi:hypothetical protein [Nostoc sp. 'Peltigera membranacea cyanobiont' N6]|uniref:hypothetical protein n=1 Tax=Nostoc sp. 'Peltigera membranacea cyanobiont' N6 TaxID=1261031 RepID=UPI0011B04B2A|nr:hypothetical protein [Nostoc sp. 'Peltigera membranacea cyanobiont' N6]
MHNWLSSSSNSLPSKHSQIFPGSPTFHKIVVIFKGDRRQSISKRSQSSPGYAFLFCPGITSQRRSPSKHSQTTPTF